MREEKKERGGWRGVCLCCHLNVFLYCVVSLKLSPLTRSYFCVDSRRSFHFLWRCLRALDDAWLARQTQTHRHIPKHTHKERHAETYTMGNGNICPQRNRWRDMQIYSCRRTEAHITDTDNHTQIDRRKYINKRCEYIQINKLLSRYIYRQKYI